LRRKCIHNDDVILVYLANPDGEKAETDRAGKKTPTVVLQLPAGRYGGRWFNPVTGEWSTVGEIKGPAATCTAPGAGDWVLLVERLR